MAIPDHPTDKPPRAWQRMLSGRRLDILDPSPLDVEIEDIALGLSRVARWNGQTVGAHAFTVAQHSVLVLDLLLAAERAAPRPLRLAALLHDASEYVTSDLITPFKAALGPGYRGVEDAVGRAVNLRFGLPGQLPPDWSAAIKRADKTAAYIEAVELAGFSPSEARRVLAYRRRAPDMRLAALPAEGARALYLDRFRELVP
ncbi:MAG: hydrolase [Alphaproteobacteria bacterium]